MRRALTTIAFAALLASFPAADALGLPGCVSRCSLGKNPLTNCCSTNYHPEIASVCDDYNTCRRLAVQALQLCVANPGHCSPIDPGRCTLKLETCVQPCRVTYSRALATCVQRLTTAARSPCGTSELRSRRNVRALERACQSCLAPGNKIGRAQVPFPTADLDPEPCQESCISRIPVVNGCYRHCDERCDGDRFALSICRRACRNFGCPRYQAFCAGRGSLVDPAYLRCCKRNDSCSDEVAGCGGSP